MEAHTPPGRDFEANPYTPDEQRVVDYLLEATGGIVRAGDDPIGFLIASHRALAAGALAHRQEMRRARRQKDALRRERDELRVAYDRVCEGWPATAAAPSAPRSRACSRASIR